MILILVGWLGTALILGAYFVVRRGALPPDSRVAVALNVLGALFVAIPAFFAVQWNVTFLQAVWAGIALFGGRKPVPAIKPETR